MWPPVLPSLLLTCPPFPTLVSECLLVGTRLSEEGRCTIRRLMGQASYIVLLAHFQECVRGWERWAEQRVLGTSHQVTKCPSIPSHNLMRTSIFSKSKDLGSTGVSFSERLQEAEETMTKFQTVELETEIPGA